MKNGAIVLILLGTLLSGYRLGEWREAQRTKDARLELAAAMARNQAMQAECFRNMRNQFTPGFRGSQPLLWLAQGRAPIDTRQGQIFATQTPTDLAIDGPGFFLVGDPEAPVYTREGRFQLTGSQLCDLQGRPVLGYLPGRPGRLAPLEHRDPTPIRFDAQGNAHRWLLDPVTGQGCVSESTEFSIALAGFPNPEFLARHGDTGFLATAESGPPSIGRASVPFGFIVPGSLELANVDFTSQGMWIGALRTQAGLLGAEAPPPPSNFMLAPGNAPLLSSPFPPLSR